jgi:hypothetical protein
VCRREQLAEAMQSLQPLTQYPLLMNGNRLRVRRRMESAFTAAQFNEGIKQ